MNFDEEVWPVWPIAFYSVSVFLLFDTNGFVYQNFDAIGSKQNLHEKLKWTFSLSRGKAMLLLTMGLELVLIVSKCYFNAE